MFENLEAYSFVMSNGYSIMLFYNKQCISLPEIEDEQGVPAYSCINGVYDMNGKKGPNQVGKDFGFFIVLSPNVKAESAVSLPVTNNSKQTPSMVSFTTATKKSADLNYRLPTINELSALVMAYKFAPATGFSVTALSGSVYGNKRYQADLNEYGNRVLISSWSGTYRCEHK